MHDFLNVNIWWDVFFNRTIPYTGTWGVVIGNATGAGAWKINESVYIMKNEWLQCDLLQRNNGETYIASINHSILQWTDGRGKEMVQLAIKAACLWSCVYVTLSIFPEKCVVEV